MYRTILVGLDGSPGSWSAFRKALVLGREADGRLHALAIEEHLPRFAATVGEMQEALAEKETSFTRLMEEARRLAGTDGVRLETDILPGHAARVLVERAKQLGADLIVLGHTRSVWGNLLGSTADKVVDHARCDVLIVR